MSTSTTVIAKKRKGPKPTGKGKQIVVRIHPPLLAKIEKWAGEFAPGQSLSNPEIIRRMLEEYLTHCGVQE